MFALTFFKQCVNKTKKPDNRMIIRLLVLAVRTGLEPATPCVTGRYSNQLNYRTTYVLADDSDKTWCKSMRLDYTTQANR